MILGNIFKIKPRIGILGLNPHNAEFELNSEEVKEIIPAIKKLRKNKVKYCWTNSCRYNFY